jgi:hypothetical protein
MWVLLPGIYYGVLLDWFFRLILKAYMFQSYRQGLRPGVLLCELYTILLHDFVLLSSAYSIYPGENFTGKCYVSIPTLGAPISNTHAWYTMNMIHQPF